MTKKDFQVIAGACRELASGQALCMDNEDDQRDMVRIFADALAETNPRFNADNFAVDYKQKNSEDVVSREDISVMAIVEAESVGAAIVKATKQIEKETPTIDLDSIALYAAMVTR